MTSNQLSLTADVLSVGPLRTNPTGQPSVELQLWHASEVTEGGSTRQLSFPLMAKAVGEPASALARLSAQSRIHCKGFVAPRFAARHPDSALAQRPGGLIFHITSFQTENP